MSSTVCILARLLLRNAAMKRSLSFNVGVEMGVATRGAQVVYYDDSYSSIFEGQQF